MGDRCPCAYQYPTPVALPSRVRHCVGGSWSGALDALVASPLCSEAPGQGARFSRLDVVRNNDVGRALEAALDTITRDRQSPSCTLISKLVSREHLATLLGWGSHRGFDSLQLAQKLESTLQQHPKWLRAEQAVGDQVRASQAKLPCICLQQAKRTAMNSFLYICTT